MRTFIHTHQNSSGDKNDDHFTLTEAFKTASESSLSSTDATFDGVTSDLDAERYCIGVTRFSRGSPCNGCEAGQPNSLTDHVTLAADSRRHSAVSAININPCS